jgi:hypothetical protein
VSKSCNKVQLYCAVPSAELGKDLRALRRGASQDPGGRPCPVFLGNITQALKPNVCKPCCPPSRPGARHRGWVEAVLWEPRPRVDSKPRRGRGGLKAGKWPCPFAVGTQDSSSARCAPINHTQPKHSCPDFFTSMGKEVSCWSLCPAPGQAPDCSMFRIARKHRRGAHLTHRRRPHRSRKVSTSPLRRISSHTCTSSHRPCTLRLPLPHLCGGQPRTLGDPS